MRLIDADALEIKTITIPYYHYYDMSPFVGTGKVKTSEVTVTGCLKGDIDKAPTIEVVPFGRYTETEVVAILYQMFGGDEPCNFNNMDEYCDEWCELNCGIHDSFECWRHAINEKWHELAWKDMIRNGR